MLLVLDSIVWVWLIILILVGVIVFRLWFLCMKSRKLSLFFSCLSCLDRLGWVVCMCEVVSVMFSLVLVMVIR